MTTSAIVPIAITPEMIREHGLTPEEFEKIKQLLGGREPTRTELGIFSVMWSEHCSYKSSRVQNRVSQSSVVYRAISGSGHRRRRNSARYFHHGGAAGRGDGLAAVRADSSRAALGWTAEGGCPYASGSAQKSLRYGARRLRRCFLRQLFRRP